VRLSAVTVVVFRDSATGLPKASVCRYLMLVVTTRAALGSVAPPPLPLPFPLPPALPQPWPWPLPLPTPLPFSAPCASQSTTVAFSYGLRNGLKSNSPGARAVVVVVFSVKSESQICFAINDPARRM
jgi:hypothetical protein